jgi:hypothetical protein
MPIIVREVEKKVINCLKIVLQYNHTPYPGKGLKTETIGALVQTCRAQHNCKAKLVQKTNKQRTQVTIWLEIASEKDPFADAVFDSIKQNCTYDNIHKEYMQFEFEGNELNTIIPCEVLVRQDGVYISGEEPVQSNSFSFDYLKTIQDNNMYKRKLMNDYSSDNVKSLLSDSSESDTQGLKRKLVAEFSMSKKPRREIQVMNTSYTVDPRIEILTGQPIATTSHATQTTLGMPTAGGSEQPIASTSHATHPALGMQTDYTPNMKKIKVFKYGENNNGRIIMVSGTIKQLREAVNEKLFKGKIKTENLIFSDAIFPLYSLSLTERCSSTKEFGTLI